jgi:arylformamidase
VDVYLPAGCGPVPVVMWVHGGGWRRGDKANGPIERKAEWAASLGAALVSVNYRLTTPDSGVRWPDHGDDVAAAVAWVQHDGPALGLQGTDITLVGHSAGAHLVAIVGADPTLLTGAGADPGGVACVVPLDFSFDLARAPAAELIAGAFGTDPDDIAAASPNVQIERNGPPAARYLVGTRGAPGRVADAQAFVDLVNDSGGTAELVDANPYSHEEINLQLGAPDDRLVTPVATEFVASCASAGDVDRPDG